MWVALIVTRSRGVWRVYLCWDQGVVERCPDDAVSGYAQSGPGRLVEKKKSGSRGEKGGGGRSGVRVHYMVSMPSR